MGGAQVPRAARRGVVSGARKGPGFFGLALGALLGVGALLGGLVAIRRYQASQPVVSGLAHPGVVEHAIVTPPERARSPQDAGVRALRSVLPADAWVVLDVDLSLLNAAGWASADALRPLDCDRVPPPARLAVAMLPAATVDGAESDGWPGATEPQRAPARPGMPAPKERPAASRGVPDLVVAALGASPAFRDCAKRKLLSDDGSTATLPGGFEVVENRTHTRLVSHAERDLLLFATASAPATRELIALIRGERPSAASSQHHLLAEALGPRALGLTASLPSDWLERAGGGPEASMSPLSKLRAAALGVRLDGTLEASLFCGPAGGADGCADLAAFLARAKGDLLRGQSASHRAALEALTFETRPNALHLTWRLTPDDVAALLAPLLGDTALGR